MLRPTPTASLLNSAGSTHRGTPLPALSPNRLLLLIMFAATVMVAPNGMTGIVSADVIDFNPEEMPVPDVLPSADRELLADLTATRFGYFFSPPSPDGRHAIMFDGSSIGFVDLESGTLMPFEGIPDLQPGGGGWIDEDTYGYIYATVESSGEDEPPRLMHHKVIAETADASFTDSPMTAISETVGVLLSHSPDLDSLLFLEPVEGDGTFLFNPRQVTLGGAPFERSWPGRPEADIPGAVGDMPLGRLDVYEAATKVVLIGADGTWRKELAELPADSAIAGVAWRPDGERLALVTSTMPDWDGDRDRDNDPPGAGLPNLGSINVQEALGNVAPADNPLVHGTLARVFDTASGSALATIRNADYPAGFIAAFDFAPTGNRAIMVLALRGEVPGRDHPTYANPDGVAAHILGEDFESERVLAGEGMDSLGLALAWIDGDTMVAAVPDELRTRLLKVDVADGSVSPIWRARGSIGQLVAGGGRLAFMHSAFDEPTELWSAPADDIDDSLQLTDMNAAVSEMPELDALEVEDVSWTTSDGQELHGAYIHNGSGFPPAEPLPMVVWQLGGPGPQMTSDYGASVESPYSILPHFGIPVFVANAAGRIVKSREFYGSMAAERNFGQLDVRQIKEGVDHLVGARVADPARVGITGCSYGGYFTLQSIRAFPDTYAAANAQCSLMDLFEEFSFGYTPVIAYLMGAAPMAEPEEYRLDSPLYGADLVRTPTLLFHGTEDFLPVALPWHYHDQLQENGVPVRFLRVEGEGHGFRRWESQAYAGRLQIEFFRQHLRVGEPYEEPPRANVIHLPVGLQGAPLGAGTDG